MAGNGVRISRAHLDGAYESMTSAATMIEAKFTLLSGDFDGAYNDIKSNMQDSYDGISELIGEDQAKQDRFKELSDTIFYGVLDSIFENVSGALMNSFSVGDEVFNNIEGLMGEVDNEHKVSIEKMLSLSDGLYAAIDEAKAATADPSADY